MPDVEVLFVGVTFVIAVFYYLIVRRIRVNSHRLYVVKELNEIKSLLYDKKEIEK